MDMDAGQPRREDVIVISDDDEFLNDPDDFDLDSDFDEEDWGDVNENLGIVLHDDHAVHPDPGLGLDRNVIANPVPPNVPHPLHNGNQALGEHPRATKAECVAQVYAVFPDICPDYLDTLYNEHAEAQRMVAVICESMENGKSYPKGENLRKGLKRKRELTEAEEAQKMYGAADRDDDATGRYFSSV